MVELFYYISLIVMLGVAYAIGTIVELNHYSDIEKREKIYLKLPVVTFRNRDDYDKMIDGKLVYGSVVISLDYFKRLLAGLRNIFGGRVISYESLLDRGRREAILRMKEKARALGFDMIINMRFETSTIGQVTEKKGSLGCFEVMAYGTAVKMQK